MYSRRTRKKNSGLLFHVIKTQTVVPRGLRFMDHAAGGVADARDEKGFTREQPGEVRGEVRCRRQDLLGILLQFEGIIGRQPGDAPPRKQEIIL